jgi:hypothetical protein
MDGIYGAARARRSGSMTRLRTRVAANAIPAPKTSAADGSGIGGAAPGSKEPRLVWNLAPK